MPKSRKTKRVNPARVRENAGGSAIQVAPNARYTDPRKALNRTPRLHRAVEMLANTRALDLAGHDGTLMCHSRSVPNRGPNGFTGGKSTRQVRVPGPIQARLDMQADGITRVKTGR